MYDLVSIYIVSGYNFDLTYPIRVQLHFLILARVGTAFHLRTSSAQQFSIILSSGERADHGKIDILFSLKYDWINLDVCTGVLSC